MLFVARTRDNIHFHVATNRGLPSADRGVLSVMSRECDCIGLPSSAFDTIWCDGLRPMAFHDATIRSAKISPASSNPYIRVAGVAPGCAIHAALTPLSLSTGDENIRTPWT